MKMTTPDYQALAAYLSHLAHCHSLAAHFSAEHGGSPTTIAAEAAEAEQLTHWAQGITADLQARALNTVDVAPCFEIPGLTDGLVFALCTHPERDLEGCCKACGQGL